MRLLDPRALSRRRGVIGPAMLALLASVLVWSRAVPVASTLPYYDSPDLTPRWTITAPRTGMFALVTQTGDSLTDHDLRGHVHVVSFIYTQCSSLCPTIVASLARVQAQVRDPRLMIVSFSVTPDADTPGALASFGRQHRIDAATWKLVTGDQRVIHSLARNRYFASDERSLGSSPEPTALLHTEKLILVDRSGRIRGVYNGTQPFDVEHLTMDARSLLAGAE